jgi:hypothetical protein
MTLNGSVIVENIYLNEAALEVTFVKSDGSGEVCHILLLPPSITSLILAPRPSCPVAALQHRHLSRFQSRAQVWPA